MRRPDLLRSVPRAVAAAQPTPQAPDRPLRVVIPVAVLARHAAAQPGQAGMAEKHPGASDRRGGLRSLRCIRLPRPGRGGARKTFACAECHGSVAPTTFICPDWRVEHRHERESPAEPELMPIRRELLLRTALLRQPEMPPLPPLRAAAPPSQPAHAPRRAAKPGARRRPARLSDGDMAAR